MRLQRERANLLMDWRHWTGRVARAVGRVLGDVEVYLLGSVVRGDYTGGSDIDVLIVLEEAPKSLLERSRLKARIEEEAGLPVNNPMEIHLIDRGEMESYMRRAGEDFMKLDASKPTNDPYTY